MRANRSEIVVAIVVSVLAHGMIFAVAWITQLLDILEQMRAKPDEMAAVELEINDEPFVDPSLPAPVAPPVSLPPVATPAAPRETPPPIPPPRPRPPRMRPPEPEPPPPEPAKRTPRAEHRILQAVDQPHESDEPTPDDPHFLSQSNRDVQEETVARARSLTENDPDPQGARPNPSTDEHAGTDQDEAARESRDREGAREADSATASVEAATPPETVSHAGGDRRPRAEAVEAVPQVASAAREGVAVVGPGAMEMPQPREGQEGHTGQPPPSRGAGRGPNLRLSWTMFQDIYGEGELRRQREEVAELRRTRIRGNSNNGNWERIRTAIENYVPDVRPGNQTALRSAASPFAVYLAQVHRRLHRLWAEGVLVDFALRSDGPLNDNSLVVNLEIVINADGSIAKVGVLDGGSGSLPYDAAAIDVVYRSAPHPNPPREIRSGDGRTYIHWAFYRNERQCGTFNAEPYLLPSPPSMPRDSGEPGATPPAAPAAPPPRTPPHRDRGQGMSDSLG